MDAGGDGVGALAAEGVAAEQSLFGRVGQEGGFNEDGRDVGRAQDGEVGFVNTTFVELVEFAQFGQDGMSQFAAVAHGGGLGHVENGIIDAAVAAFGNAADGIGVVLGLGEEFSGRAGRAFGVEHIHAGTARGRAGEGVGVDRDEHVGIACAGFGDAHAQRDEDVFVAGHVNGVAYAFKAVFGFAGDGEDDVFLFQAARTDGTGVFTAMTGVYHDDGAAAAAVGTRRRVLGNVRALGRTLRLHAFRRIAVEQRHHRVVGIDTVRIKVDHEAVFKAADRGKREDLRMGVLLEVDHNAHGRRGVLSGADAADVGVVGQDFAGNALQDAVDVGVLDVDDEPAGVFQGKMLILQRARAFDGDTGIGVRRPNTGGDELGGRRGFGEGGGNRREGEQQSGSLADDLSSCQFEFNHASKLFCPLAVCAVAVQVLPCAA